MKPSNVVHLHDARRDKPRRAAENPSAQVEPFNPHEVVLEMTFSPEPGICMRTVCAKRLLTPAESAQVGKNLRKLQAMLLEKLREQTGAGFASGTGAPTAP